MQKASNFPFKPFFLLIILLLMPFLQPSAQAGGYSREDSRADSREKKISKKEKREARWQLRLEHAKSEQQKTRIQQKIDRIGQTQRFQLFWILGLGLAVAATITGFLSFVFAFGGNYVIVATLACLAMLLAAAAVFLGVYGAAKHGKNPDKFGGGVASILVIILGVILFLMALVLLVLAIPYL